MPRYARCLAILLGVLGMAVAMSSEAASDTCRDPASVLLERVASSVVSVRAERRAPDGAASSAQPIAVSGLRLEHDGEVLTTAELITDAVSITVTFPSNRRARAEVNGVDPTLGIALLRAKTRQEPPIAPLGDAAAVRVGDEILAVGRVAGGETVMTRGIVSRRSRAGQLFSEGSLIEIDAAIRPDMAGGPLVNRCGDVIALTLGVARGAGRGGFALPLNLVLEAARDLRTSGRVVRPWIGLRGRSVGPELASVFQVMPSRGYLVESVDPGSPADRAGIRGGQLPVTLQGEDYVLGGDVLTTIGDVPIRDEADYGRRISALRPGERVRLTINRHGHTQHLTITVAELPAARFRPQNR